MNRHQTWSHGGVESGELVEERIEPIPQKELDRQATLQRLRAARVSSIAAEAVPQLLADILEVLDI